MTKWVQTMKAISLNGRPVLTDLQKIRISSLSEFEDRPARTQIAVWAVLVVVAILVSLGNYQAYQFGAHYDDSRYAVLARSLVYSNQYGMINIPGEPAVGKYPFGYPLFLVPSIVLFPDSFDALKVPSLIATILNGAILFWGWRWLSRTRSYWWAIAIVALYALSPLTIDLSRRVMSEPVFTTFCLLAIVLAEQAARGRQNRWWSTAMSAVLVGAAFTRIIGVLLVPTIFIYLLLIKGKGFWKEIVLILTQMTILLGLVLLATPVHLRDLLPLEYLNDQNARLIAAPFANLNSAAFPPSASSSNGNPVPIVASWSGKLAMARDIITYGILWHFGKHYRMIALPIGGGEQEQRFADLIGMPVLPFEFGFFVSALVIFGLFRWFAKERLTLFPIFAVVYSAVLFLWVWNDIRLLYPIQPQIHLGFLLAIEAVALWAPPKLRQPKRLALARNWIFTLFVLIMIAISLFRSLIIDDSRSHTGDLAVRSSWLKANSTPGETIMSEAPETDYLYSGRKTVPYPFSFDSASELEDYLVKQRIDYILVAPFIGWQTHYTPQYSEAAKLILPLIEILRSDKRLELVYSGKGNLVQVWKTKQ